MIDYNESVLDYILYLFGDFIKRLLTVIVITILLLFLISLNVYHDQLY